jgi:hypothetical protein
MQSRIGQFRQIREIVVPTGRRRDDAGCDARPLICYTDTPYGVRVTTGEAAELHARSTRIDPPGSRQRR